MSMSNIGSSPSVPRVSIKAIRDIEEGRGPTSKINVGQAERWVSAIGGGLLIVHGLRRGNFGGLALALLGGGLAYRGLSGHCQAYEALKIDTSGKHRADDEEAVFHGVLVKETFTINRTPGEIYAAIKDPSIHKVISEEAQTVTVNPEGTWHWEIKGPFGVRLKFDSELIVDKPGEIIAWKSLPGGDINNAGSIRLVPAWDGRGTEVTMELNYEPPAGVIGATIAKIFPQDPARMVRENLRHLKQLLEAGEIATTVGQTSGRA